MRNIYWLPLIRTLIRGQTHNLVYALTGNQTLNLSVYRTMWPCIFNPQQCVLSNGKELKPFSRLNSHERQYGVVAAPAREADRPMFKSSLVVRFSCFLSGRNLHCYLCEHAIRSCMEIS